MRKLQTQDVFKMARIIKKANMKDMIKEAIHKGQLINADHNLSEEERSRAQNEVGVDIFMGLIDSCSDVKLEELLYDFLSGVFETSSVEDIGRMSLDSLIDNIKKMIQENDIGAFFKAAGRLQSK